MRNTRSFTRPRRFSALALILCLLLSATAGADDLASDLGGGFQATDPMEEQQQDFQLQANMTDADISIGYVEPGYPAYSPVSTNIWSMISVNQLVFESVVDLDENL